MGIRKGFKFNELRALHARLGELIAESDSATAAASGDYGAPTPAAMDSATSRHDEDAIAAHYRTMEAITPHASRIWKSRR